METKAVIEFLGYNPEEVKTIEDLKGKFDTDFVRAKNLTEDNELVKPLLGKVYGTLENELKKVAKPFEIDLEDEDFKAAKKVTEKVKILTNKITNKFSTEIETLKTQVGKGNDEKVNELMSKLEKEKQKAKELNDLLSSTKQTLEQKEASYLNEIKGTKLSIIKDQAMSKVKFKSGITDIEKEGYNALIAKNYLIDLDDEGEVVIKTKSGERLKSDKKAGSFKTLDEVLEEEAVKAKLFEINSKGNNTVVVNKFDTTPPQNNTQPKSRQVAKRLGV